MQNLRNQVLDMLCILTIIIIQVGYQMLRDFAADIDIIFLDVVMPHIDGIECLSWVKSNQTYNKIPIHMLSGVNDTLLKDLCLQKVCE